MAFTVQNSTGSVAGANSYTTVAEFKAHCDDYGLSSVYAAVADSVIEGALVRATSFLDSRWRFVGTRRLSTQTTSWPRTNAFTNEDELIIGIPADVKLATNILARATLDGAPLTTNPPASSTGGRVVATSQKVGPLEIKESYAAGGSYSVPVYPEAQMALQKLGLTITSSLSGETVRA